MMRLVQFITIFAGGLLSSSPILASMIYLSKTSNYVSSIHSIGKDEVFASHLRSLKGDESSLTTINTNTTTQSNQSDKQSGLFSSANDAVIFTLVVIGFLGVVVLFVIIIYGIFSCCRHSCIKSKNKESPKSPVKQVKRLNRSVSSPTATATSSPGSSPVPVNLNRANRQAQDMNISGSESIISFLESAGNAYHDLKGTPANPSKHSNVNKGKNTRSHNDKVQVDIAGMSMDSSSFPTVDSHNSRLGGGQYHYHPNPSSNATFAGDRSLVSIYSMSQLYPDDEFEYVYGR